MLHGIMADAFARVARGELKRLIINMPPRHTKSEFASYLLPAWFFGQKPDGKVIQTSHTAELAVGFGRKVRNLVSSKEYQEIFPGVGLQADSKAAGRWRLGGHGHSTRCTRVATLRFDGHCLQFESMMFHSSLA